jgi:hypothetical protein
MALFLQEDELKKLGKKTISVPKDIMQKAQKQSNFVGSKNKKAKGFKELSVLAYPDYNHRTTKRNKDSKNNTVTFSYLKGYDERRKNLNPKSEEFQNMGDDDIKNWVHNSVEQARSSVKEVMPVKINAKIPKPKELKPAKDLKIGNASVTLHERKIIYISKNQLDMLKQKKNGNI